MTETRVFDMGMGDLNISVAQSLAIVADPIIGVNFDEYLSDSRMAMEIIFSPEDVIPCTFSISKNSKQTCNQVFYMPGTSGDFVLQSNGTLSHADFVIIQDMGVINSTSTSLVKITLSSLTGRRTAACTAMRR
jgi:hypothetical protein